MTISYPNCTDCTGDSVVVKILKLLERAYNEYFSHLICIIYVYLTLIYTLKYLLYAYLCEYDVNVDRTPTLWGQHQWGIVSSLLGTSSIWDSEPPKSPVL